MNLPDQPTITGADSSITVSFTSYDNLGSMLNTDSNFSSSVLSVNVLGVEKVRQKKFEITILKRIFYPVWEYYSPG